LVLFWLLSVFLLLLIGRLILSWVQAFARDWRPHGPVLVIA
jgi:YggT family protein